MNRRAVVRIFLGLIQLILAFGAVLLFVRTGLSQLTLALTAATAAAVVASLVMFRHER